MCPLHVWLKASMSNQDIADVARSTHGVLDGAAPLSMVPPFLKLVNLRLLLILLEMRRKITVYLLLEIRDLALSSLQLLGCLMSTYLRTIAWRMRIIN